MRLPEPSEPFVLLDDARVTDAAPARLYRDPVEIVRADTLAAVQPALDRIADARDDGLHVAGYMAYEAGFALDGRGPAPPIAPGAPLLWFGLFDGWRSIDPADVPALLPDAAGATIGAPQPLVDEAAYATAFAQVAESIRAGDIYQANLTFPCTVDLSGDPRAIYAAIRPRARAGYGGIVHDGQRWLLSFSPELFFTLVRGQLTARPMKGTAPRAPDGDDAAVVAALRDDPKQRSENLMIVDLLRNDLSRVSRAGTVTVPQLFHVETYPTVHQMISTVKARLLGGLGPVEVLRALFPCGSVTGAPKLKAMEVIRSVEPYSRGVYTGSIGRIDPDGSTAFNVAIRTISVEEGARTGRIGLGSGIVADSDMQAEWRECLAKGRFLTGA